MKKIICIGDNVVDIYTNNNICYPGGNAYNVAVYAQRLGLDSSYIGLIGTDETSQHIYNSLILEKVNIDHLRIARGQSGMAWVHHDENGDRRFIKSNKGGIQSQLSLRFNPKDKEYIYKNPLLHTSIYSAIDDRLSEFFGHILISYDFSNSFTEELVEKICPYLYFAFYSGAHLSEDEIRKLAKKSLDLGCQKIVITIGDKGAYYFDKDTEIFQPAKKIKAIDTLGAGDSFITRILVGDINGEVIEETLKAAADFAATTCLTYGAIGYPKEM